MTQVAAGIFVLIVKENLSMPEKLRIMGIGNRHRASPTEK